MNTLLDKAHSCYLSIYKKPASFGQAVVRGLLNVVIVLTLCSIVLCLAGDISLLSALRTLVVTSLIFMTLLPVFLYSINQYRAE